MGKSVQIDEDLFEDLWWFFACQCQVDENGTCTIKNEDLIKIINKARIPLDDKANKMYQRMIYSEYKTNNSQEALEKYKQERHEQALKNITTKIPCNHIEFITNI